MTKQEILGTIDEKGPLFCELSDAIWEQPETAFQEDYAAGLLCQALEEQGFAVTRGLAGIATAFCGRYGSGKPVIGILGEFDALSGLSQKADVTQKEALHPGAPGHGCGHNLLGAGALAAAVAIKEYLSHHPGEGTVIYFGCPGEEGGSGKAFMARDGVFDELDCALTWHPGINNGIMSCEMLANCQVLYRFDGVSSHAGSAPHMGRSALDAVELMNVGVQFLREHMISQARIHYAITDTGGYSPNVVQGHAEVLYLIRAPKNDQVAQLKERVDRIAQGAALMTDTKMTSDFIKACSNTVINETLERVLLEQLEALPTPNHTPEEVALAAGYNATVPGEAQLDDDRRRRMTREQVAQFQKQKDEPIYTFKDVYLPREPQSGSTDVGDVSWVCPTAQIKTATWASRTPGHSWQVVAQGKSETAHKGMLYAGKVLAATALELFAHPEILYKAWEEHRANLEGQPYVCPIPQGVVPRQLNPGQK